jgi:hypothetical protein
MLLNFTMLTENAHFYFSSRFTPMDINCYGVFSTIYMYPRLSLEHYRHSNLCNLTKIPYEITIGKIILITCLKFVYLKFSAVIVTKLSLLSTIECTAIMKLVYFIFASPVNNPNCVLCDLFTSLVHLMVIWKWGWRLLSFSARRKLSKLV